MSPLNSMLWRTVVVSDIPKTPKTFFQSKQYKSLYMYTEVVTFVSIILSKVYVMLHCQNTLPLYIVG